MYRHVHTRTDMYRYVHACIDVYIHVQGMYRHVQAVFQQLLGVPVGLDVK